MKLLFFNELCNRSSRILPTKGTSWKPRRFSGAGPTPPARGRHFGSNTSSVSEESTWYRPETIWISGGICASTYFCFSKRRPCLRRFCSSSWFRRRLSTEEGYSRILLRRRVFRKGRSRTKRKDDRHSGRSIDCSGWFIFDDLFDIVRSCRRINA